MSIKVTVSGGLGDAAEQAMHKAFQAVAREAFASMQQSFTAEAWDWPGETERGGGAVAGSPRNLIDTGNLRQSGFYEFTSPTSARFTWSANYAGAVHEGYRRFRADGSFSTWPARPWTAAVLGRVKVPGIKPFPAAQRLRDVWLAHFRSGRS